MSGVSIIGDLLLSNNSVLEVVPADRIKAGKLPDGVALPALLVRSVSLVERQMLKRTGVVRTVERVSVTVRAANYRQQGEIVRLVRKVCAGKVGAIDGFENVSTLTAGTGPDLLGPGDSFEQAQDFRVSFDAPA